MKIKVVASELSTSDFDDSKSFINALIDESYGCLDDLDDYAQQLKDNSGGNLNKLSRTFDKKLRYARSALDDIYFEMNEADYSSSRSTNED